MTDASTPDTIRHILIQGGWNPAVPALVVHGTRQILERFSDRPEERYVWPVSTGQAGFGNLRDSGCTPTGLHRISDRFGDDAPLGAVFKARQPTGEIVKETPEDARGDYITTRILWLDGLEPGINRGGEVDSHARYIYIHGTPHVHQLGKPVSAGCVRMGNQDIQTLFDLVSVDTFVLISAAT